MSDAILRSLNERNDWKALRVVFIEVDGLLAALAESLYQQYGAGGVDYSDWVYLMSDNDTVIIPDLENALREALTHPATIHENSSYIDQLADDMIRQMANVGVPKDDLGFLYLVRVVDHHVVALHFNYT